LCHANHFFEWRSRGTPRFPSHCLCNTSTYSSFNINNLPELIAGYARPPQRENFTFNSVPSRRSRRALPWSLIMPTIPFYLITTATSATLTLSLPFQEQIRRQTSESKTIPLFHIPETWAMATHVLRGPKEYSQAQAQRLSKYKPHYISSPGVHHEYRKA
jgi:hypothetical protein